MFKPALGCLPFSGQQINFSLSSPQVRHSLYGQGSSSLESACALLQHLYFARPDIKYVNEPVVTAGQNAGGHNNVVLSVPGPLISLYVPLVKHT